MGRKKVILTAEQIEERKERHRISSRNRMQLIRGKTPTCTLESLKKDRNPWGLRYDFVEGDTTIKTLDGPVVLNLDLKRNEVISLLKSGYSWVFNDYVYVYKKLYKENEQKTQK